MAKLLETDTLSNQNISSALEVGSFTASADKDLLIQVLADQVQGNGDYEVYITRQIGGAGSAYKSMVSIESVASGVTAIMFNSIQIPVKNGDIVKAYLLGLPGDNATVDTRVEWWDPIDGIFVAGSIEWPYLVTNQATGLPIEGADVWISTDNNDPPTNIIWRGSTNTLGYARSVTNTNPYLDPGTYYFWVQKAGFDSDSVAWPDTEVVA